MGAGEFLGTLFKNLGLQLLLTVGVIVLFGLLIALCRRGVIRVLGYAGYLFQFITGFVGVPVHELSHAAMCLVFFHHIDEIKLYDPSMKDGSLGHVSHSYNVRNPYQRIGNFFIGIAPIVVGTALLFLLMYWLVPDVFTVCTASLGVGDSFSLDGLFDNFMALLRALFRPENFARWKWWLFMLIALPIANHMELSYSDIRGSADGLFVAAVVLLCADLGMLLLGRSVLSDFTGGIQRFSLCMCGFLMIAVVLSFIVFLIALLIALIRGLLK